MYIHRTSNIYTDDMYVVTKCCTTQSRLQISRRRQTSTRQHSGTERTTVRDFCILHCVVSNYPTTPLRSLQYSNTGSPYLLLILALFVDVNRICKELLVRDIASFGTYLRWVPGETLKYIQQHCSINSILTTRQRSRSYRQEHLTPQDIHDDTRLPVSKSTE
jgi:hypothetical protein